MRVWFFVFLYGSLAFAGAFLSIFWGRLARERARVVQRPLRHDRYFVLAASIATFSAGLVLVDGTRAIGNLQFGLSPILLRNEAIPIGLGLVVTLIGMMMIIRLADLERHPPKWTWLKSFLITTLVWAALSAFLAPMVPMS